MLNTRTYNTRAPGYWAPNHCSTPTYRRPPAPLPEEHAVHVLNTRELLEDVARGHLLPGAFFRQLEPSVDDALLWVRAGRLRGETLLQHCEAISTHEVTRLHVEGHISQAAFFRTGRAPVPQVLQWIDHEHVHPPEAVRRYALPPDALESLHMLAAIDARTYATRWQRGMTLPHGLLQSASAAALNDEARALEGPPDPEARRSLRLQLMARRVESLQAQASAARHTGAANDAPSGASSRLRRAAHRLRDLFGAMTGEQASLITELQQAAEALLQQTREAPAPLECLACFEPFTDASPSFKWDSCEHPPHFHVACMTQAFDAHVGLAMPPVCPSEGCNKGVSMAEGRALDPDRMDALATDIVRSFRPEHWFVCETRGCIGGTQVPPGIKVDFHCVQCDAQTKIENMDPVFDRLRDVLVRMIADMGAYHAGAIRSCYHCGTATARDAGCAEMVCGRDSDASGATHGGCGRRWNFNTGASNSLRTSTHQAYVPCAGDMVEAGLYAPLRPGQLLRSEQNLPPGITTIGELVARNAVARGWIELRRRKYVLRQG